MAQSEIGQSITVENVVVSTGVSQELDLEELSTDLVGADYVPDNFPGLIYRTPDPHATSLIFRSGKIVCTGADSTADARECVDIVTSDLEDLGINIELDPVIVQNIVASGDLGESLNLNAIAIGLGLESVEYEPEQFPGLVYRMDEPDAVILLFGSGKCVITGTKDTDTSVNALETISEELESLGLR